MLTINLYLNPDYAETYLNKGLALKIQGKFYEAIIAYKKSISLKPDYPNAYRNMGNAFLAQGMIDQAISSYISVQFHLSLIMLMLTITWYRF